MIKKISFEDATDEYKKWFNSMESEGSGPKGIFDPTNAFRYDIMLGADGKPFDEESPYTVSGQIFGIDEDGSFTNSLVVIWDGDVVSLGHSDLGQMLSGAFPDVEFDSESDMFFAYAKSEEDASALTDLLNDPEYLGVIITEAMK